jgi:uncharacterized protein YjbI with pentapeptide repeats
MSTKIRALTLAAGLCLSLLVINAFPAFTSRLQDKVSQRGVRPIDQSKSDTEHGAGPYFALVIGINDYRFLPKLKTAIGDAESIGAVLRRDYGFQVKVLRNASRDQIESALNEYRSELPEDANLLIYYAGHGTYDKEADKAYWLPVDAKQDDNSRWILADVITTDIKVIKARHIMIISDSCFSGGLSRSVEPDFAPKDPSHLIERLMQGRSRTLMSSGGLEPVTDAGGAGHSVFVGALLKGLEAGKNESFSAPTLFAYVQRAVAGNSEQVPRYASLPNSGDSSGDFVFLPISATHGGAPVPANRADATPAEKNRPSTAGEPGTGIKDAGAPTPSEEEGSPGESMGLASALSILQRASEMMPTGDIGQSIAIESLIRNQHSLGGMELWGLSLKRGRFNSGDFSKATMVAVDLARASAANADFTRTNFAFAILDDSALQGATVEKAKFDFANAERAQFQNSKAAGSRWFATDAQAANFTGANLSGSRFMFADLRNAVFDGADLTGAFLVGSDLTGASFKKAKLGNTDFTGSILDTKALDASQVVGACETHYEVSQQVFNIVIIDDIPSSRFDGGMEHSRFFEKTAYLHMSSKGLKVCEKREFDPDTWYPYFSANGKDYLTNDFGLGFPDRFVAKRGSDLRSRVEELFKWVASTLIPANSVK